LELRLVNASANVGEVIIRSDNMLYFTPKVGFSGTDVINYTIEDDFGLQASAQVIVQVRLLETLVIRGKASRGSLSIYLIPLILLIWLYRQLFSRRNSRHAKGVLGSIVAIVAVTVLHTPVTFAQELSSESEYRFEVRLSSGLASSAQTRGKLEAQLPENADILLYQPIDVAKMVNLAYALTESWHLQAGYASLSHGKSTIRLLTETPLETHAEYATAAPLFMGGFVVGIMYRLKVSEKTRLDFEVGYLDWQATSRSLASNGDFIKTRHRDRDPFVGVALGRVMSEKVGVAFEWRQYSLDYRMQTYTIGVWWRF
ncbi:Ig-like domain-containing protein, partial [Aliidiomarina sp.]|uniref:Ig-like domain-containing protein n=1 Tax=Aliidiomarina sp. TaxID=1872439 RepID=UPI003A4E2DB3